MKDNISIERIKLLSPYAGVQELFTDFITECENSLNITLRIMTPVFRSIAEQDALYEQGRTNPGNVVTNAKGGSSFHNYGLAVDLCELSDDGHEVNWGYDMGQLDPIAKKYGIEWGGDWHTIKDKPHFQVTFGHTWQALFAMPKDQNGYVIL